MLILISGGEYDAAERYMDVTLLSDVGLDDDVMQEEIFGPLMPVVTVNSVDEAVDFINAREKPLSIYVYSERAAVQEAFIARTTSGGLTINECLLQLSVETLPFGGVGNSGMGSYHGKVHHPFWGPIFYFFS